MQVVNIQIGMDWVGSAKWTHVQLWVDFGKEVRWPRSVVSLYGRRYQFRDFHAA